MSRKLEKAKGVPPDSLQCYFSGLIRRINEYQSRPAFVSMERRVPVQHLFDGFRTSHEVKGVKPIDCNSMKSFIVGSNLDPARSLKHEHIILMFGPSASRKGAHGGRIIGRRHAPRSCRIGSGDREEGEVKKLGSCLPLRGKSWRVWMISLVLMFCFSRVPLSVVSHRFMTGAVLFKLATFSVCCSTSAIMTGTAD